MDFDGLTTKVPEYYKDPYKWERYDAPYQMARFRGDGDTARVEVYYALPGEEVERKKAQTGAQFVAMRQGLFLFDANWDTLRKDVGRVERDALGTIWSQPGRISVRKREADVGAGEIFHRGGGGRPEDEIDWYVQERTARWGHSGTIR